MAQGESGGVGGGVPREGLLPGSHLPCIFVPLLEAPSENKFLLPLKTSGSWPQKVPCQVGAGSRKRRREAGLKRPWMFLRLSSGDQRDQMRETRKPHPWTDGDVSEPHPAPASSEPRDIKTDRKCSPSQSWRWFLGVSNVKNSHRALRMFPDSCV